jgi:hypothetical protein
MDIPFDLLHIVASYLVKPKMILLDWVDIDMLDWDELMNNPNAHNLIETAVLNNPDVINWNRLCLNPNAIHILETVLQHDPDKINWYNLSKNPNAIHLLEIALQEDPDKIDWKYLSANPNAIHILEKHPDKIDWKCLSTNPNAIHILEKHPDKIDLHMLSANSNLLHAIHLIEEHLENSFAKIDWNVISRHASRLKSHDIYDVLNNPDIKNLLQNQLMNSQINLLDDICFKGLSLNPNAFHILKKYPENICWNKLSLNPNHNAVNELIEKYAMEQHIHIKWDNMFCNPDINIVKDMIDVIVTELDTHIDDTFCIDNMGIQTTKQTIKKSIKINWYNLSSNPYAIHLIEKHLIPKYPKMIDWYNLSKNPKALHILKNNPDEINYKGLSENPSIFEIDTKQLNKDIQYKTNNIDNIHR